ncbi:hypothetical protein [Acrocarpospora sp. B8E8]|uniref:hypothetical protein n=1 Tax=Acrocarpospora sp. B8E8 TaxID=3153572 RepID=UPI00325D8E96
MIRRLCVSMTGCAPDDLEALIAEVSAAAQLERLLWNDSVALPRVGVLPPGFDESRVVADLVTGTLAAVLRSGKSLSVRLALHEGPTFLSGAEFGGPAVETVRAMCVGGRLPAPLTVVISGRLFDDVVAIGAEGFPLRSFRPSAAGFWRAFLPDRQPPDSDGAQNDDAG